MVGGSGSAADSNGDDNIVLYNAFDEAVDAFGRVGEDGTETDHEFEDGRALRKSLISSANATYDSSEWQIWNDTGTAETTKQPQKAPQDYSPGFH